jgi:hypothetical protein
MGVRRHPGVWRSIAKAAVASLACVSVDDGGGLNHVHELPDELRS